jgi:hypothetical protein
MPILGLQSFSLNISSEGIVTYPEFPKLKGVNINDWQGWSQDDVDRELADVKNRGFNFVRLPVWFHRFFNIENQVVDPSMDPETYNKFVSMMNYMKDNRIWVSLVPMEVGGLTWLETSFWWTNPKLQSVVQAFYRVFVEWCKDMGWTNILYISVWWEASFYTYWYDGYYVIENQLPNYNEANADWRSWLSEHDVTPVDLTNDTINTYISQYTAWSRDRFNMITKLKSDAIKAGWPGIKTGGEIGFAGNPTWSPSWHPAAYLQICAAPYLDVLTFHDYMPDTSYAIEPYLATAPSSKPIVMEEVGAPWWSPYNLDATKTDGWWNNVRPKMDKMYAEADGFAIWSWKDYSSNPTPLGLKDLNFNSRPILSLVEQWLLTHS